MGLQGHAFAVGKGFAIIAERFCAGLLLSVALRIFGAFGCIHDADGRCVIGLVGGSLNERGSFDVIKHQATAEPAHRP